MTDNSLLYLDVISQTVPKEAYAAVELKASADASVLEELKKSITTVQSQLQEHTAQQQQLLDTRVQELSSSLSTQLDQAVQKLNSELQASVLTSSTNCASLQENLAALETRLNSVTASSPADAMVEQHAEQIQQLECSVTALQEDVLAQQQASEYVMSRTHVSGLTLPTECLSS